MVEIKAKHGITLLVQSCLFSEQARAVFLAMCNSSIGAHRKARLTFNLKANSKCTP